MSRYLSYGYFKISQIYDKNPQFKKKFQPIFITVDPLRDNQNKLFNFMENFNSAFFALTGTDEEIKKIIKSFKIYVSYNKKDENDETYLIDHSSLIFSN